MNRWRDHVGWLPKIEALDPRVQTMFELFLDKLDAEGIAFAVGDTRRDVAREWELWKQGRATEDDQDPDNPYSWVVVDIRKMVTRVPPGSGKGPHFFGLAADIYAKDEHGALMQTTHPHWQATITKMWELAEACDLDALGHQRKDRPGDAYWSGDPSHYQAQRWVTMLPPITREV